KDFRTIKKNVVGALHVAALDDYRARTHLHDLARGGFHIRDVFDGHPGENFGFRDVRGDDAGALQEFSGDVFDARGVEEFRATRRFHDRIVNDVGKLVSVEEFRDHHGVAAVAEHSDLYRGDLAIPGQGFKLRAQFRAGCVMDGFDTL